MKDLCYECGGEMGAWHTSTHPFRDLPHVMLTGISRRECTRCDEAETCYPHMEDLIRTVAYTVATRPGKLSGRELRYLRKYLMWTGAHAAKQFGVSQETVSRWETEERTVNPAAERIVRWAAALRARPDTNQDAMLNHLDRVVLAVTNPKSTKTLTVHWDGDAWGVAVGARP